jgi:magnesium transporter
MHYALTSYEANATMLTDDIERMEKLLFTGRQTRITLRELYHVKSSSRLCRRILGFTRDVITQHVTTAADASALQDVNDTLQKLLLSYDEIHDDAANLSTVYLSLASVKTNDAMKLLTVFSVFFMPLTFIAGIYGMNFKYMPELDWRWGYPMILFLMAMIGVVIFIWFKRKKVIQ